MDSLLQGKDTFVVSGFDGEPKLSGEVSINGAKNAALPLMAAAFLFDNEVSFSNFPESFFSSEEFFSSIVFFLLEKSYP